MASSPSKLASPVGAPASSWIKTVCIPSSWHARTFFIESSNITVRWGSAPTELSTLSKASASGLHAGITSSTANTRLSGKKSRMPRCSKQRIAYARGALVKATKVKFASFCNVCIMLTSSGSCAMYLPKSQRSAQYSPSSSCRKGFGKRPSSVATVKPFSVEWYRLMYSPQRDSASSAVSKPNLSNMKSRVTSPIRWFEKPQLAG
mmetsp:Transcript_48534/g.127985  ORF Transcript_48534/g.127985 Transcript_48534/m.127985 type:complete len:205 (-) Transcript_48534:22-636(-)